MARVGLNFVVIVGQDAARVSVLLGPGMVW
jgi:hypothetical protein